MRKPILHAAFETDGGGHAMDQMSAPFIALDSSQMSTPAPRAVVAPRRPLKCITGNTHTINAESIKPKQLFEDADAHQA
jgi:hypothetical protein